MKMKLLKTYFLTTLLLVSGVSNVQAETYGDYLKAQKDIPTFEQYKVKMMNDVSAKVLDISRDTEVEAWKYRTNLRGDYNESPNFAGHFVISKVGCGVGCQLNFVMDKETGKVVGTFNSSMGSSYMPDSRLLIVDPLLNKEKTQISAMPDNMDVKYYELKDNKLFLIKRINKDSISK